MSTLAAGSFTPSNGVEPGLAIAVVDERREKRIVVTMSPAAARKCLRGHGWTQVGSAWMSPDGPVFLEFSMALAYFLGADGVEHKGP